MIRSIMFDGKSGYIGEVYKKEDKPKAPSKTDWDFQRIDRTSHLRVFDEERYNKAMERYRASMEFYESHKGKYKVPCSENLVGRTFYFKPDKINLIFGPNASGSNSSSKN